MISKYEVWSDAGQQNWSCNTSAEENAATSHHFGFIPRRFGVTPLTAAYRELKLAQGKRAAKLEMQERAEEGCATIHTICFHQHEFDIAATSSMPAEKSNDPRNETAKLKIKKWAARNMCKLASIWSHRSMTSVRFNVSVCIFHSRSWQQVESKFSLGESK
jgi:hypothetical protein